jgi:adenine-specific DNA-methyltransferase
MRSGFLLLKTNNINKFKNHGIEFVVEERLDKPFYPQSSQTNTTIHEYLTLFPKTRYYGSKKRILGWIYENLKDLEYQTVLDCFGGTASVSLLFQAMGKDITFHDALQSNTISAKVLLRGGISSKQLIKFENFFNEIKPLQTGFISQTFQTIYFTDEENNWLDGAIEAIKGLKNKADRELCLYVLFQASMMKRPYNLFHRANLYLRNADVKRSFGNLTTWNTPFPETAKKILYELHKLPNRHEHDFCILSPSSAEEIPAKYDLVYIDPPYISDTTKNDGYWKKYHFLEGIAQYDKWHSMIDDSHKTKMLHMNPHIKKWESKHQFTQRLFNLVEQHKNSIVVLSYMTNAIPSVKELEDFFRIHFKQVILNLQPLSHALAKAKRTEILLIGIPL